MGGPPPVMELIGDGLRLNIGCGKSRFEDCINCDLYPGPNVDRVFDACKTWPFEDNTVKSIYCSHTLEHLPDPGAFFQEAWRVLKPNGVMQLAVPFGGHRAAWWDVTHIRPWYPECFAFLQPGYLETSRNLQHGAWTATFKVADTAQRVSARFAAALRWWLFRWLFIRHAYLFVDAVEELFVYLIALKTPEQVESFHLDGGCASSVPSRYVIYNHHWEGTAHPAGPALLKGLSDQIRLPAAFHSWGRSAEPVK